MIFPSFLPRWFKSHCFPTQVHHDFCPSPSAAASVSRCIEPMFHLTSNRIRPSFFFSPWFRPQLFVQATAPRKAFECFLYSPALGPCCAYETADLPTTLFPFCADYLSFFVVREIFRSHMARERQGSPPFHFSSGRRPPAFSEMTNINPCVDFTHIPCRTVNKTL